MSEGDTYPLDGSAEMWRKRALQAEADLKDECNRHGEILFVVEEKNARLREALIQLRDCDWVITLPDRMDAVRDIARRALDSTST